MILAPAFETEEEVSFWAIGWLQERGYCIIQSRDECEFVRPGEFRRRFSLRADAFRRRLEHPDCPPYRSIRGPGGRIKWIIPNPDLIGWMSRPLRRDSAAIAAVSETHR